jgi:hypothetical protein
MERLKLFPFAFSFMLEYGRHQRFSVDFTDVEGTCRFQVQSWYLMLGVVRAFAKCVGSRHEVRDATMDVFKTGYAAVRGMNIRVTPLSEVPHA